MEVVSITALTNPDFSLDFENYLISAYSEKLSTPIDSYYSRESLFVYDTKKLQYDLENGRFSDEELEDESFSLTESDKSIIKNCKQDWIVIEIEGSLKP